MGKGEGRDVADTFQVRERVLEGRDGNEGQPLTCDRARVCDRERGYPTELERAF